MPRRWYLHTWLPFWRDEKKILPAFLLGTFWLLVRLSLYAGIGLGLFMFARRVGDTRWSQYKIKALSQENKSLKTAIVDTVAKAEVRQDSAVREVKVESNKQINNLVVTLDSIPKEHLRKVIKADTLMILRVDSARKDTSRN